MPPPAASAPARRTRSSRRSVRGRWRAGDQPSGASSWRLDLTSYLGELSPLSLRDALPISPPSGRGVPGGAAVVPRSRSGSAEEAPAEREESPCNRYPAVERHLDASDDGTQCRRQLPQRPLAGLALQGDPCVGDGELEINHLAPVLGAST